MRCFKAILLLLLFFYPFSDASVAKKKSPAPCLTAVYAEQAGDSQLFLYLEGTKLSRPEIAYRGESELALFLDGVSFPAVRYEREIDTPLVPQIRVEQSGSGVLVTLLCEAPLQIRGVRGAGTNRVSVHLRAAAPAKEKNSFSVLRESGDAVLSTKKISLNMKDCDLADAFRVLSAMADVNIVVDSSVSPSARLTLSFRDAPFHEVFRYILRSQNLDSRTMGRTVVVGAKNSLGMLVGRLTTKGYRLAYADPQKVAPILKEMAELLSPANKILVDERQNLLIVTATAVQQERVRASLEVLDARLRQVMLKARIIEVSDDASDELETALNAVYDWWWSSYQNGQLSTGVAHSRQYTTDESALPNVDTSSDLPGTIGNGIVDLAGTATRMLDFRLNAIVEKNKAKILADPTVTVIDGQKATVKLVEKLKYVSRRDDANNPTYDDEEVGPCLEVTPRIGRGGVITVNVSLSTGEVVQWVRGGQGEEIPQTNSRSVTTTVNVRDGEPFVIGGLYKNTLTRSHSGIPVLENLPLIGTLFQSRSVKKTRSQVVMVVVPCILDVREAPDFPKN